MWEPRYTEAEVAEPMWEPRWTEAEVAELERPYIAYNGHKMYTPVTWTPGGNQIHSSAFAECCEDCQACVDPEGLPLEDW